MAVPPEFVGPLVTITLRGKINLKPAAVSAGDRLPVCDGVQAQILRTDVGEAPAITSGKEAQCTTCFARDSMR
jgi:hypothetical protein